MKSKAYACAIRLLSRREHGAQELTNKLVEKGYSVYDAQEAVVACQRLNLQSDARFVDNLSRARIRQGYGPIKIQHELQHLAIDRALIEYVLAQEQENWLEYARLVWKKKYKEQTEITYAAMQKQKQFLLYRGFSTDTITYLFRECKLYV